MTSSGSSSDTNDILRGFFEGLHARGAEILFVVDARRKDVVIPNSIRHFSARLPIHLRDRDPHRTTIDDDGVHSSLAFSGHVMRCHFPWSSIWVITDIGTGNTIARDGGSEPPPPSEPWVAAGPKPVHKFRVVKGGKA